MFNPLILTIDPNFQRDIQVGGLILSHKNSTHEKTYYDPTVKFGSFPPSLGETMLIKLKLDHVPSVGVGKKTSLKPNLSI